METKRTCPECNLIFAPPQPEPAVLTCPLCDAAFAANTAAAPRITGAASVPPAATSTAGQMFKGCIAVAALLFLAGGLVYGYRRMASISVQAAPVPAAPATIPPTPTDDPVVVEVIPTLPAPPVKPSVQERPSPRSKIAMKPPQLPELSRPPASLPERVNLAIDRGVAYLRASHGGHDQYRNYLGILGLTLLECGAPTDDPAVRQIAGWLRTKERDLAGTYELALAILFLDRLGEPGDRTLIRTFGQRLVAGQHECGAWTYTCPLVETIGRPSGQLVPYQGPQIISRKHSAALRRPRPPAYHGDNSNTQFAILGLWVAQRHGVSVRRSLLAAEQYFRQTQSPDGSWAYRPRTTNNRDSMTCAGLMSLAMRYGVAGGQGRDIRPEHPVQVHDRAVSQGLHFLGVSLDKILVAGERITGVEARTPLYFLWSLERMAVIYDLRTIGEREWYPWAAEMLVQTQHADGSWRGAGAPVGTCFALLVLKRSNLAHDLQLTVSEPRRGDGPAGPTVIQVPDVELGPTIIQQPTGAGGQARPGSGATPGARQRAGSR